jgi:hypothetical protein
MVKGVENARVDSRMVELNFDDARLRERLVDHSMIAHADAISVLGTRELLGAARKRLLREILHRSDNPGPLPEAATSAVPSW